MKLISNLLIAASLATGMSAYAQESPAAVAAAREAAQQWLALVDAKQHGASWDQASAPFQAAVSKADWERTAPLARTPLGELKQRTFKSAKYTTTLPQAPAGEYVQLQYASEFANKPDAAEMVVTVREKDGKWKVVGYFIQ